MNYHWQSVFYLSALIGLVVALLWVFCSRDGRKGVVTAETAHAPIPWRKILASRSSGGSSRVTACLGYVASPFI